MNCYTFSNRVLAQSACDLIWKAVSSQNIDINAATGEPVARVTTAWAIPIQRITDGKWYFATHPTFANALSWAIETFDPSWQAAQS